MRFEDTYGLCDLFCAIRGLEFLRDTSQVSPVQVSESVYVVNGLGNRGCFSASAYYVAAIESIHPDLILTVFDLDSGVNHREIMSSSTFASRASRFESGVKKYLPDVKFEYIPTVYAAETIMLYQFMRDLKLTGAIEELVHNSNTWSFQALILAIFNRCDKVADAKVMRNYINTGVLLDNMRMCINTCLTLNGPILRFLLGSDFSGLTLNQTVIFLDTMLSVFKYYLDKPIRLTVDGVELDTNTAPYSMRDQFKFFPKRLK